MAMSFEVSISCALYRRFSASDRPPRTASSGMTSTSSSSQPASASKSVAEPMLTVVYAIDSSGG